MLPIPLPLDVDERLNATGVVGICRGYCFNGTLEPFLSVDNISSRSIYNQKKKRKKQQNNENKVISSREQKQMGAQKRINKAFSPCFHIQWDALEATMYNVINKSSQNPSSYQR